MENELILVDEEPINIEDMIYEIRGVQVMLDSDLAKLYKCKNGTKEINQAVKNNIEKFPERYAFRITEKEFNFLKSNFLTSKGGSRKGHTVFTEQGVAMLATILKTPIATKVSIAIMDAFVAMRKYISNNIIEQKIINKQVLKNSEDIKVLKDSFKKFEEKRKDNEIYYNGQIFDAYYKIHDIFKKAKKEIIIIDSYADNTTLDIIKRLKVNVIIITKSNNLLTKQDIMKFNKQYDNLKVIYNDTYHDRYFIIDKEIYYHCGASINRIGYKTFSTTRMNDEEVCKLLINKINNII